jgi:hypothetical protein
MTVVVLWVAAQCSPVEVTTFIITAMSIHHLLITLMMKVASITETSVNFYQTTSCYNPEDSHLITPHHIVKLFLITLHIFPST